MTAGKRPTSGQALGQQEELHRAQAELEIVQSHQVGLYDLAPVGYFTLSEKGLILEANLAAASLLGVSRDALVNQPFSRFLVAEEQDGRSLHREQRFGFLPTGAHRPSLGEAGQAGAPLACELRMVRQNGTRFWGYLVATVAQDSSQANSLRAGPVPAGRASGGETVCRAVLVDITKRKRAEERLRSIVDCLLGMGIDTEANINRLAALCGKEMGAACCLFNRVDRGMLCSVGQWQPPPGFQASDKPDGHICYDVIMRADDQPLVIRKLPETAYARSDPNVAAYGLQTYIGVAVKCHGQAVGSLCVVYQNDVEPSVEQLDFMRILGFSIASEEERQRAESALRESAKLHRDILRTASDGFWMADMQGRLLDVNAAYCRMSGYSEAELLTMRISDVEIVESDTEVMSHVQRIMAQGQDRFESRHRRKDGSPIDVEVSVLYLPGNGGRCVTFVRNITDRKRKEAERERLEAQLRHAQKMESVGRLAGGVAHDFNNMLGVIIGNAEMAIEKVVPGDPLHDDLKEIRQAAEHSAVLTGQLLAFARKQTVAPKVLDLNETVEGMLKMLTRLIGEDIDLVWKPTAGPCPVRVDPSQIDQVLANLCVNARDAIADIGKITIETGNCVLDEDDCFCRLDCVPGEYVLLAVSDNGAGMDAETRAHLFEPFFTTKEVGQGTGLGLATVYGIVKQNNGFICAYSEPDYGTTLKVYLPRYVGKADVAQTDEAAKPAMRGHETILLVEDEPAMLKLMKRVVERLDYTVLAAGTPGEAIRLAQEYNGEIHLLMTDVIMPEMNGRELAKSLLPLYPNIKRLFMSGYTADVIAHHGVLDKGVHFIQKPVPLKDLAAKVREVLDDR